MPTLTHDDTRASWRAALRGWPRFFLYLAALVAVAVLVNVWAPSRDRAGTPAQDDAAKERARQFLVALEFKPGPVACRSERSGSAWCTIREGSTLRVFQLFCSWRHPVCVENAVRINP